MPSIDDNKQWWDGGYAWTSKGGGDEWSRRWGAVSMQWYGTILPRIHRFLPAATILEIGCGYGRWTDYLKDRCQRLIAVDVSEECVEACGRRFREHRHVSCHANDGTSLQFVGDRSIDFAFSFDALPLVDVPTMDAYLAQLPRVLKGEGVAFLHHSNLGAYKRLYEAIRRIPALEGVLERAGVLDSDLYWRDADVSARIVQELATKHGLHCVSQEIIRWGTRFIAIDAFTVVTNSGSPPADGYQCLRNMHFDNEVAGLSRLAPLYVRPHVRRRAGADPRGDAPLTSRGVQESCRRW
ncbi:MAG: class I SAM-dependent methyltransferase [Gemmatimonadetes bacterium]|nr:class I SAM-dependent methyltransferase [Gemmatimonadota bacterium]